MSTQPPSSITTVAPPVVASARSRLRVTKARLYELITSGASIGFVVVFLAGMLGSIIFAALAGPHQAANPAQRHLADYLASLR